MLHERAHTEDHSQYTKPGLDGKVHGSRTADDWKSISYMQKSITYACAVCNSLHQRINRYSLMQDTSDLLRIFLVLLISFLIQSFCRHFKMHNVNMKSSFTSAVPTEKSPEFATQPILTALQPSAINTFGYSYARAQMCLQAFEETRSRHWLQTLAPSLFQLLSRWCNT